MSYYVLIVWDYIKDLDSLHVLTGITSGSNWGKGCFYFIRVFYFVIIVLFTTWNVSLGNSV